MAEREDRPKGDEKSTGSGDAAREKLPPAQDQDQSLKVHGDKLEPKKG